MLVQEAHRAAKEQVQTCVPQGVYVSCCLFGSPAQASLKPGVWIHAINQTSVASLKDFIAAVDSKQPTKPKSLFQYQELDSNEQDLVLSPTDDASQASSEMDNDFQSDSHVQIKYTTIANVVRLTTLKLDKHYWPMWHLKREDSYHYGWRLKSFD
jgi:PDZ domain-containing secreted protein